MKRIASLIVRITICAALIYWLIKSNRFDFTVIKEIEITNRSVMLCFIGFLSVFCGLFLLGLRLWILLCFKRFTITFKRAFGITLLGAFWGVLLPGLAGGDVVKAGYLAINVSERRMDAVSTIFMDRVVGLFSLFLVGAIAATVASILGIFHLDPIILMAYPVTVILLCFGVFIFITNVLDKSMLKRAIESIVPTKILDFVRSVKQYFKSPKLIVLVIMLSILNHLFVLCTFIIGAVIIDDNIAVFTHFILNPLAMAMNIIPITPGGIGIAESAFSFLFQIAGSPNGAVIGFLGRFIQYGSFVICGGVTLISMRYKNPILTNGNGGMKQVLSGKIPESLKG